MLEAGSCCGLHDRRMLHSEELLRFRVAEHSSKLFPQADSTLWAPCLLNPSEDGASEHFEGLVLISPFYSPGHTI